MDPENSRGGAGAGAIICDRRPPTSSNCLSISQNVRGGGGGGGVGGCSGGGGCRTGYILHTL